MTRDGARMTPVKTHGGKSRIIPWLSASIDWYRGGRWIEPFMGSCKVALSFCPPDGAIMSDDNPYLVDLCRSMRDGTVSGESVKSYVSRNGELLRLHGADHYYAVRDRFNETHDPHDMLFLNHASYNGLMRWNSDGLFNAPYGHNPCKFDKDFLDPLCRRVRLFRLNSQNWKFGCMDWREALKAARPGDFIYMDPPYEGLHSTYFSKWPDGGMAEICDAVQDLPCGWAVSSWSNAGGRENPFLEPFRSAGYCILEKPGRYVLGPVGSRNVVTECLVLSRG